ncbi:ImmA/IrrE family metallo-endopeptidase [Pseudobacteriovorax antillogorgiicola]|uniref:IrrE N-terminal-like domain-containing protein n=1 Tax=Pseudobacteriovorax antillogorgiicola TaxID=1513793 RepID=A0A1Y6BWP1_9BACT|nr:ImmA/IrrE family metallo-endopeptidase [Pseudobacteriovorax antillogorgiicola]TCS50224.1 uncharacterized protein DUF955 [Pseudobacteriovorax antillogorgiicola]SMF32609.1 protein of unknown function [Pseudobacteriovorax antillogorgiicola]
MKRETSIKYPHSASLFQFCRKVLDQKFGGIRVIDQDVGQILGFDPADCSHWKKGKKNIRSIQAMKSIAKHLGVDEKLVVDVASGEMADWEAFQEYSGYGHFEIDPKLFDTAKKEFYRKHANTWTREKEQEFKNQFTIDEDRIDQVITRIHETIQFKEAPLYLPEIVSHFPSLTMKPFEATEEETELAKIRLTNLGDQTVIEYPMDVKMRPFIRFSIAKAMGQFFFDKEGITVTNDFGDHGREISEVQYNLFAAKLLTPAYLIKQEMNNIDIQKDIVSQLSEIFWVSKTFMNSRLKDILQGGRRI